MIHFCLAIAGTTLNRSRILHKAGKYSLQQNFHHKIIQSYTKKYRISPKSRVRLSTSKCRSTISEAVRYDGQNHFPKSVEKRRRCAGAGCKTAGRVICSKCDVGLCLKCFEIYHSL